MRGESCCLRRAYGVPWREGEGGGGEPQKARKTQKGCGQGEEGSGVQEGEGVSRVAPTRAKAGLRRFRDRGVGVRPMPGDFCSYL